MKMKTRTKKYGVFAVLAVALLLSVALVTTCVDPIGPEGLTASQKEEEPFVPPEGMGYFRINVDVEKFSAARTIFPTKTYTTVGSFVKREVYITGGASSSGNYNNLNWDGTTPIAVDTSGTAYGVTVVGYNGDNVAVAIGSNTVTVATTTTGEEVSITMKEITSGTYAGNGTLALSLDNDFTVDSATANVIGLSTGATHSFDAVARNVLVPANTTFALPSGYYQVELTLNKDGYATAIYRELVVIWSGMTTTYSATLILYSNQHTVTYQFHDGITSNASKIFTHGDWFTHPGAGSGNQPTYTDHLFQGWFTESSAGTQVLTGSGGTRIIKPQTVHAQWLADTTPPPNSQITWDIDVDYSPDNAKTLAIELRVGGSAVTQPYSFSQDAPPAITFDVTGASPALTGSSPTYPTYNWTYQGTGASLGTNKTLVIDFAAPANYIYLNTNVPQVFKVRVGDAGADGTGEGFYDATITITVNQ